MNNKKLSQEDAAYIIYGAFEVVRNAQSFCEEAEILHENGKFARAYVLSHFAREECGKAMMLARAAIEVDAGIKINLKKLNKRVRCHKQKIINDNLLSVLIMHCSQPDATGSKTGGLDIGDITLGTVKQRNNLKNGSLYVNYEQGEFTSPLDLISDKQSKRNLELASFRSSLLVAILKPFAQKYTDIDFGDDKHPLEDFLKAGLPSFLAESLKLYQKAS